MKFTKSINSHNELTRGHPRSSSNPIPSRSRAIFFLLFFFRHLPLNPPSGHSVPPEANAWRLPFSAEAIKLNQIKCQISDSVSHHADPFGTKTGQKIQRSRPDYKEAYSTGSLATWCGGMEKCGRSPPKPNRTNNGPKIHNTER